MTGQHILIYPQRYEMTAHEFIQHVKFYSCQICLEDRTENVWTKLRNLVDRHPQYEHLIKQK